MIKSLLAHPLNGTTAKALLEGQLKIAARITADTLEITKSNTGIKIAINPF
jgi:hypothetical protein